MSGMFSRPKGLNPSQTQFLDNQRMMSQGGAGIYNRVLSGLLSQEAAAQAYLRGEREPGFGIPDYLSYMTGQAAPSANLSALIQALLSATAAQDKGEG